LIYFFYITDFLKTEDYRYKDEKISLEKSFKRKIREKDYNITKLSEENRKMKQKVEDKINKLNEEISDLEKEKEEIINEAQNKIKELKEDISSKNKEIEKPKKENNDLRDIKENFFSLMDKKEKETSARNQIFHLILRMVKN